MTSPQEHFAPALSNGENLQPSNRAPYGACCAADRLLRQQKQVEMQQELRNVSQWEKELTNTLQSKYRDVTKFGDGGLVIPVNNSLKPPRKSFVTLCRTLTDIRLPVDPRLRLWHAVVISALFERKHSNQ